MTKLNAKFTLKLLFSETCFFRELDDLEFFEYCAIQIRGVPPPSGAGVGIITRITFFENF